MQDKASKCSVHPSRAAVANCDRCGIGVCITCGVPVRGEVLGPECLPEDLRAAAANPPAARTSGLLLPLTGIGFALALLASALPWKRYGLGSGPFGAWGLTLRWSIGAGVAALCGMAFWIIACGVRRRAGKTTVISLRIIAALVLTCSVLHLLRAPGFGPPAIGPWVSLAGGALALAGTSRRGADRAAGEKTPVVDSG